MILMLHIIVGIISLIAGGLALARASQTLLRLQIGSFGLTLLSGVALVVIQPSVLTHLCVSGVLFSAVSIALMLMSRQALRRTAGV